MMPGQAVGVELLLQWSRVSQDSQCFPWGLGGVTGSYGQTPPSASLVLTDSMAVERG